MQPCFEKKLHGSCLLLVRWPMCNCVVLLKASWLIGNGLCAYVCHNLGPGPVTPPAFQAHIPTNLPDIHLARSPPAAKSDCLFQRVSSARKSMKKWLCNRARVQLVVVQRVRRSLSLSLYARLCRYLCLLLVFLQGVLRGYDPFMNLVLDDTTDPASSDKKMGMVIIRGNSVIQFEILDPLRF